MGGLTVPIPPALRAGGFWSPSPLPYGQGVDSVLHLFTRLHSFELTIFGFRLLVYPSHYS